MSLLAEHRNKKR